MRVVALTLSYVHARRIGAELAVHALLTHLKAAGHQVEVVTTTNVPRQHVDGIRVAPRSNMHTPPADLVITNAGLGAKATTIWRGVPVVVWAHNSQLPTVMDVRTAVRAGAHVVANTRHMADVFCSVLGVRSMVLHPPVVAGPVVSGECVTLVNLSPDKGAGVFWDLARARPDLPFLGVKGGYGLQDVRDLPNVTVVDHGDMGPVWERTRILLVPSRHESYSMTGVEAATRGIPAVVSDLPGVREALGAGAVYVADDQWARALGVVDGRWDEFSANATFHAGSRDQVGELDATAAWLEGLGCDAVHTPRGA